MEENFGMLNCLGKNSTVSDICSALDWECLTYGISIVPLLVLCTNRLLHVVIMMIYHFAYYELLFLFLVGIMVYGCNQIIQICGRRMIGGEECLIIWSYLDWFLPAVLICTEIGCGSLYLQCIVPLWSGFEGLDGYLSIVSPVITWGNQLVLDVHGCNCTFKDVDASVNMKWNPGLILRLSSLYLILWSPVSFPCHFYSLLLSLG